MVGRRSLTKINELGVGFVSEDILLSEIFHQINCEGSSSPVRMQKHVQTSFVCRQRDAYFSPQAPLNLLALQKHKNSQAVHHACRIQPSTCGKEFRFQRCLAATGLLWGLITN